jgi:hypothetical protein
MLNCSTVSARSTLGVLLLSTSEYSSILNYKFFGSTKYIYAIVHGTTMYLC